MEGAGTALDCVFLAGDLDCSYFDAATLCLPARLAPSDLRDSAPQGAFIPSSPSD